MNKLVPVALALLATVLSYVLFPYFPLVYRWLFVGLIYALCLGPVWHFVSAAATAPLLIFAFTLVVTFIYNDVGNLVPQKEVYPPKEVQISANMSTAEMVSAGKEIVSGKGTCLSCHGKGARFPALDGIGGRAGNQKEGMSDVDYLAESLYDPNAFIVPTFAPGMPPVHKPPIGLSDQEILTVIAYLQSMGGTPSVTMETKVKGQGSGSGSTEQVSPPPGAASAGEVSGEQLAINSGCGGCHSFTSPDRMLGPSLFDIGKRLNTAQIYEAIMEPDATIAAGDPPYAPGVMGATLSGGGFYDKVTSKQLKQLVDYLTSLKGGS